MLCLPHTQASFHTLCLMLSGLVAMEADGRMEEKWGRVGERGFCNGYFLIAVVKTSWPKQLTEGRVLLRLWLQRDKSPPPPPHSEARQQAGLVTKAGS